MSDHPAEVRAEIRTVVSILRSWAMTDAVHEDRFEALVVRAADRRVRVDDEAGHHLAAAPMHHARLAMVRRARRSDARAA